MILQFFFASPACIRAHLTPALRMGAVSRLYASKRRCSTAAPPSMLCQALRRSGSLGALSSRPPPASVSAHASSSTCSRERG